MIDQQLKNLIHWSVYFDLFCHQVEPEQVVMSHSPLQMFRQFMDKHVLVSGQGPTLEIAKGLGFTKVSTIDDLRDAFPKLDMVDERHQAVVRACLRACRHALQ